MCSCPVLTSGVCVHCLDWLNVEPCFLSGINAVSITKTKIYRYGPMFIVLLNEKQTERIQWQSDVKGYKTDLIFLFIIRDSEEVRNPVYDVDDAPPEAPLSSA